MKTISAEEFKKLHGTEAVKLFSQKQPDKTLGNLGSRIKSSIQKRGENVESQISGSGNPLLRGIKATGQAFGAVADVASDVLGTSNTLDKIGTSVGETVGKGFNAVTNKIADTELFKGAATSGEKIAGEGALEAAASLGETAGVVLGAAEGLGAATKAITATKKIPGMITRVEVPSIGSNTLSKKLYETAIGRTTDEAERVLAYRAKKMLGEEATAPITRADTAQKYGLAGRQTEIGVQAKAKGKMLYKDVILPALKNSKETITKDDLFAPIKQKIDNTVDPSRKLELQEAFDAIQEDYINESIWNLEKAQELKRGIDKFTPDKVFRGKPISSAYNELRHDMADAIRQGTYEKLKEQGIKQKYIDYGNLLELEKIGIKGLTDNQLKGGAGSFISGLIEKTVTPIATYAGKVLYRVPGTKVNFIATPGFKSMGEYLQSQGYDIN